MTNRSSAPFDPLWVRQIFGIGVNHPCAGAKPERPIFFQKAVSTLAKSGSKLTVPDSAQSLIAEAELAVLVEQPLSIATPHEVVEACGGVVAVNDITALPFDPLYLLDSKSRPGFCPHSDAFFPGYVEPDEKVSLRVDGIEVAHGLIADLYLSPAQVVATLSARIDLMPGDLVLCGGIAIAEIPPTANVCEVAIGSIGARSALSESA